MRFVKLNQVHLPAGRSKYRSYGPETMTNAYFAVKEENMPIRKAAKSYGVPYQTLRDRVAGDVDPECCSMGKQPLLSLEEEAKLVDHLKEMAVIGYGYTRQEVADMATAYAIQLNKKQNQDPAFSMNWFYGFLGRWPELKVVKPRSLEVARAKAANVTNVSKYFKELDETLDKYQLKDKPHLIYNVDEKGLTINHRPPNVVAGCDTHAQKVTSGKGQTITLLGCGNAVGNAVPPYFVFPGKRMVDGLMNGSSVGAVGTVSESGWSNSSIFLDWLSNHFIKFVPRGQKVLLKFDGHKSHVTLNVIEWAKDHDIILQLLPAHTSHLLQPLDVGCFGPLQKIYDNLCHKLIRTKECVITRYDVCDLACRAYTTAVSANNLQSAFRKTGIYPFDLTITDNLPLKPSEVFIGSDVDVVDNMLNESGDRVDGGGDRDNAGGEVEDLVVQFEVERVTEVEDSVNEKGDADEQEQEEVRNSSRNDFFGRKIAAVMSVKGERKTKKRNVLSGIVSGKTVTEDVVLEKVREHKKKYPGKESCVSKGEKVSGEKSVSAEKDQKEVKKKVSPGRGKRKATKENGESSKAGKDSFGKRGKRGKRAKVSMDTQKAGTSYVYVSDSDLETESESEIADSEKCCVCKLFTPEQVRNSVSLVFTKWAKCDSCGHWVHLVYCTKVRVVRRGDNFKCVHCE